MPPASQGSAARRLAGTALAATALPTARREPGWPCPCSRAQGATCGERGARQLQPRDAAGPANGQQTFWNLQGRPSPPGPQREAAAVVQHHEVASQGLSVSCTKSRGPSLHPESRGPSLHPRRGGGTLAWPCPPPVPLLVAGPRHRPGLRHRLHSSSLPSR